MTEKEISEIKSFLFLAKNVVIVPHRGPDGDAVGSCLALWHFLKNKDVPATIIAPNDFPEFLKWMPGSEKIRIYEKEEAEANVLIDAADVVFTLDFNHLSRTSCMEAALQKAREKAKFILIDHHQQPDNYADYMYSDVEICSTCQMMFHFFEKLEMTDRITAKIATCLYTGIMTDTGSFKYRSTSATTHHVIANLIQKGADNTRIHENIYDTNSFERLQLLGKALNNLRFNKEYNTAYITLTQEELDHYDFQKGDTEGFVNYGLSLKGVILAAIFIENKPEKIVKISLRSKGDFSVNALARAHFDGGGHINAAGGKSNLSMEETIDKFMAILPQYKADLQKR